MLDLAISAMLERRKTDFQGDSSPNPLTYIHPMRTLLSLSLTGLMAMLLLAAPAAAQTTAYDLAIDPNRSDATWWGNTSLGSVVGTPNRNFQLAGTMAVDLGAPGQPFGTGQIAGGDIYTIPGTLSGKINNPIPFLPPLAYIDVVDMHMRLDSSQFTINANGSFTATVTGSVLSGDAVVTAFGSTTTTPLAGTQTTPFTVSGTIVESAGMVVLDAPIDMSMPITGTITGTFGVDGDVHAEAPVSSLSPTLSVANLTSGQTASFNFTGGAANSTVVLVYSLAGGGSTYVPQLNTTLDLAAPVLAAGPNQTNALGGFLWNLPVPPGTTGFTVWFQGAQMNGVVSNVAMETIQ